MRHEVINSAWPARHTFWCEKRVIVTGPSTRFRSFGKLRPPQAQPTSSGQAGAAFWAPLSSTNCASGALRRLALSMVEGSSCPGAKRRRGEPES